VVFVTNRNKTIIEDHFDYNLALWICCSARQAGHARPGQGPCREVNIISVRQKKQLGLGMPFCAPGRW
jgi:UTP--glucose-1-phosphate uridylyltransferase